MADLKIGKVSEAVLKRSIFKQIHKRRDEVLVHPGVGEDCAILSLAEDEAVVLSTDPITGAANDIGTLAVHVTANDLASSGAEGVKNYLKTNRCYTNAIKIDVKGIVVHSTGVAQPDVNVFLKSWNSSTVTKCAHAFVTESNVVQTLPWTYKGWHAGGTANASYIGFEILEPAGHTYSGGATMVNYDVSKNKAYFEAVYQNAVELCAYLCEEYSLDPIKNIICHQEGYKLGIASNHADVLHWFPKHGKTMDDFRTDVKTQIASNRAASANTSSSDSSSSNSTSTSTTTSSTTTKYRVQLGSFTNKSNATALVDKATAKGITTAIVTVNGKYVVQAGTFSVKSNAENQIG